MGKGALTTYIIGILTSLFLLGTNITGNVVSNSTRVTNNTVGIFLLALCLVGIYLGRK